MTRARRWVAVAALLVLVAGGALAYGQVSGTFAIFTAETENPNAVFQGSWIPPILTPTSALVNSGSYNQAQLSWTLGPNPPSGNPITGYSLEYAPGGSGGSAACGAYGAFSAPSSSPTTVTGNDISQWWCFRIHATSATVWTSSTVAFTPQRLFVPTGVALSEHGGTAGSIEKLDQIAITFNQAPSNPGTITVSTTSGTGTGSITIGSIGTISGLTVGSSRTYDQSTTSIAGNTLTIVIGASTNGVTAHSTPVSNLPGTFTGNSSFTSSGSQNLCSAAACTVSPSGSF
jgi:hypothetical protein